MAESYAGHRMRDHGRIYCAFWSSNDVQSMSDDAKLLAAYLLSCQHGTIAGVFRLPDGYACEDLRWTPERVCKGFVELASNGFANRCETTKWVWVRKYLDWNKPENPNQWKAVDKVAALIPSGCSWLQDSPWKSCRSMQEPEPQNSNPLGTLKEPFRNQDQDQDQDQEKESRDVELHPTSPGEPNGNHASIPGDVQQVFDHWREVWGKQKAKLDNKRRKAIQVALKSYPLDDLRKSISGYRNSPHHRGENDRKTPFDDIELFLRDSKHVEVGIGFAEKASGRSAMYANSI